MYLAAADSVNARRFKWQRSGMLRFSFAGFVFPHAGAELQIALESIICYTLALSESDGTERFTFRAIPRENATGS